MYGKHRKESAGISKPWRNAVSKRSVCSMKDSSQSETARRSEGRAPKRQRVATTIPARKARPGCARPAALAASRYWTPRSSNAWRSLLLKGPEAHGFPTPLWTCPRVARLIGDEFGVRYHEGHVWKILRALRWSPQRPGRQSPRAQRRGHPRLEAQDLAGH